MKLHRSTKCTLKYVTTSKKKTLNLILEEYSRVVNAYIDAFWDDCPQKFHLLKPVIDLVDSWGTFRLKQEAAREAIGMIKAEKESIDKTEKAPSKPTHSGKRMCLSSTTIGLQLTKKAKNFDCWLHLSCIGNNIFLDLPIKLHKHFHKLDQAGKRLNSYIITKDYVQFCFEIKTEPKLEKVDCIGIDTGINALATLDTGEQFGTEIKEQINKIKRKKRGSKSQKRARRALKQMIDETAKEVVKHGNLVVTERLKNITKNTKIKRRLNKSMRRSIGSWNVGYWLMRLEQQCEWNRVSFRTVSSYYTSQTCSVCGHIDRRNRKNEVFRCQKCGHTDNADVNAARNILQRFLSGPYGAGCKPRMKHFGDGVAQSMFEKFPFSRIMD